MFNENTAVETWYNELYHPGHKFDAPEDNSGTGHFTALVWKSSTHVGFA